MPKTTATRTKQFDRLSAFLDQIKEFQERQTAASCILYYCVGDIPNGVFEDAMKMVAKSRNIEVPKK